MIICYDPGTLAITHAVQTAAPEFLAHLRATETFIETDEGIDLSQYEPRLELPGPGLVPKRPAIAVEPDLEEFRHVVFNACDLWFVRNGELGQQAYYLKRQAAHAVEGGGAPPSWLTEEADLRGISVTLLAQEIIVAAEAFEERVMMKELQRQQAKAAIKAATTVPELQTLLISYQ
jgi:hypothetical protein